MGARSRKSSLAPDDVERISATASLSQTPSGTSPISPEDFESRSPDLRSAESQESLKNESPDSYVGYSSRHVPFHSESTNSLNSAFTDTAPSSFSPGPLSPTSPFFAPDSGTAPGEFVPPLTARPVHPASPSTNPQRPRSQTFPLLDQYMSGTGADVPTPKYVATSVLDSPMEEPPDPLININEAVRASQAERRPRTVTPAMIMRPPPLSAHKITLAAEPELEVTPSTPISSLQGSTSPEEARRAARSGNSLHRATAKRFLGLPGNPEHGHPH